MNPNVIVNKDMQPNSIQVSKLYNVEAGNTEFDRAVLIKNITEDNVAVKVKMIGCEETVTTVFYPGWNVELVCAIINAPADTLQYGY